MPAKRVAEITISQFTNNCITATVTTKPKLSNLELLSLVRAASESMRISGSSSSAEVVISSKATKEGEARRRLLEFLDVICTTLRYEKVILPRS